VRDRARVRALHGSLFSDLITTVRYKGDEVTGTTFAAFTGEYFPSTIANSVVKSGVPFTEPKPHRHLFTVIVATAAAGTIRPAGPDWQEITAERPLLRGHRCLRKTEWRLLDRTARPPLCQPLLDLPEESILLPRNPGVRVRGLSWALAVAVDEARVALRAVARSLTDTADDFDFNTSESLIEIFHNIVRISALAVTVISLRRLDERGSAYDIMLSRTERTREIGVRKGSRRSPPRTSSGNS